VRKLPPDIANLFRLLDKSGDGLLCLDEKLHVITLNSTLSKWFQTLEPTDPTVKRPPQTEAPIQSLQRLKSEGLGAFLSDSVKTRLITQLRAANSDRRYDFPLISIVVPAAGATGPDVRKDDRTLEIRLQPVALDDNRSGAIGIARDVSGRVSVERALDAARRAAEETSAAKTDILYSVSHDIRTPVNGALGFLELLRKTDLQPTQIQYVDTVDKSIRSMIDIIDQLLEMARIESGYLDFNAAPVDVIELLQNCLQLHQLDADAKSLKLGFKCQASPNDAIVQVDAARLSQVVNNLLTNAVKFTQSGNINVSLSISPRNSNSRNVEIKVSDTGIGIYPDELERLFKAYQKSQRAVTRRAGGIGLGLAISRRLVKGMGGNIDVQSRPNEGSVFKVTLPLLIPTDTAAITEPQSATPESAPVHAGQFSATGRSRPGHPPLVLTVDDSDINLSYISTMLEYHGLNVLPAISGQQAIEYLDRQKPDLIVLDIHMPALNGFEVLEHIKQRYGESRPPVVALTADASRELRADITHAGFDDVLFKPASEQDFIDILERHLGISNELLWQKNLIMFSDQLKDMIRSLEQPDIENDRIRVSDISHRIAGTASYLGAGKLTHQARLVQDFARRPIDVPLRQPIEELINVSRKFLSTAHSMTREKGHTLQ